MLKTGIRTIEQRGIHHVLDNENRIRRFKPWLSDCFSFLYDQIMEKRIFPKKLNGDMALHFEILRRELDGIHDKHVLELATGSGNAAFFLNRDNYYKGTDISPGLLRRAARRFRAARFKNAIFYVASAEDLPFKDNFFNVVLCHLALNFFSDLGKAIIEVKRVLNPGGALVASVPVPERNRLNAVIRGNLPSEEMLRSLFQRQGFLFSSLPDENGALLYFTAVRSTV